MLFTMPVQHLTCTFAPQSQSEGLFSGLLVLLSVTADLGFSTLGGMKVLSIHHAHGPYTGIVYVTIGWVRQRRT